MKIKKRVINRLIDMGLTFGLIAFLTLCLVLLKMESGDTHVQDVRVAAIVINACVTITISVLGMITGRQLSSIRQGLLFISGLAGIFVAHSIIWAIAY